MVIPESLIKFGEEGDSAYVEIETQPQVFEKRYIKTGLSDGVNIEVKEGLGVNDKIKGQKKEDVKKPNEEENQG
jgi:HlyD family secretion protein